MERGGGEIHLKPKTRPNCAGSTPPPAPSCPSGSASIWRLAASLGPARRVRRGSGRWGVGGGGWRGPPGTRAGVGCDRERVVLGKGVSVRVGLGGRRII